MKSARCMVFLVAGLVLAGCSKKAQAPPPPAPTVVSAAPAPAPASGGYIGGMMKGEQLAVKTADLSSLNQAVQLFNVQEGRNPKDLDELVSTHYIGKLPAAPVGMKLVYDATTGKVSTAKQ